MQPLFFSGNVVGIHPISGSSGDRKNSFVVSITSSFLVLTRNCRTAFSLRLISSIRTFEVCPAFLYRSVSPKWNISELSSTFLLGSSSFGIKFEAWKWQCCLVVKTFAPTIQVYIPANENPSLTGNSGKFYGGWVIFSWCLLWFQ